MSRPVRSDSGSLAARLAARTLDLRTGVLHFRQHPASFVASEALPRFRERRTCTARAGRDRGGAWSGATLFLLWPSCVDVTRYGTMGCAAGPDAVEVICHLDARCGMLAAGGHR